MNSNIISILILFLFSSCSTRVFYISTDPPGALVQHAGFFTVAETDTGSVYHKLTFIGKNDSSYFNTMKRGYYEDTIWVNKDSELNLEFILQRRENVDLDRVYRSRLDEAALIVLPPIVDVILHKGVGNLDSYEKSEKLSNQATINFCSLMKNQFKGTDCSRELVLGSYHSARDSMFIKSEVMEQLKKIKPGLLPYYGNPPTVACNGKYISPCVYTDSTRGDFLVLTYCKSIKATTGRIVGNMAATAASGAVAGYQTAMYGHSSLGYNSEAFRIDNSTLVEVFYIHPESGEVVVIKQMTLPHEISNPDVQEKVVNGLPAFIADTKMNQN